LPVATQSWSVTGVGVSCLRTCLQPVELLVQYPAWLFIATLAVMLLRAPDLANCWADRFAFFVLTAIVLLRALVLRQSLHPASPVLWPMAALIGLVVLDLASSAYDVQLWSVAAAKFFVPYAMFYLAGLVFADEHRLRALELFAVGALGYLTITSIAYVADLDFLVFPKFILNPDLGMHIERARGPFLQAQANGTALNLLGLLVLDAYRRGSLRGFAGIALFLLFPVAILATKTRAVWLTFAISTVLVVRWTKSARVRRAGVLLLWGGGLGLAGLVLSSLGTEGSMRERLHNEDTVEFRMSAYRAGWSMFLDRPLMGWGASETETELAHRIDGFRGRVFVVHNTYLEILLEYGLLGFALYASIWWTLLRLRKVNERDPRDSLLTSLRGSLWPVLLTVHLLSGCFVVMNYQFVNALVFTLAGILAADQQKLRQRERILAE
jgi:O-antigen ligase